MELYNKGEYLAAFKEFILSLEKNKNNYEFTRPILTFIANASKKSFPPSFGSAWIEWLKEQVEAGNSCAMDRLGDEYYFGNFVTKDYVQAMMLFGMGTAAGNHHARYNLAYMYIHGFGSEVDAVKAFDLLLYLQSNGCPYGNDLLKKIDTPSLLKKYEDHKEKEKVFEEVKLLREENATLREENERLKLEIQYMPGGAGYQEAKEHAEMVFSQMGLTKHNM